MQLRTFDSQVTLDIDNIKAIERYEREYSGYRKYTVYFYYGDEFVMYCEPWSLTLEKKYPEFTEWFLNLGKDECATISTPSTS